MKAMILAGGRGTRVRPLTDAVPKPMIPIINRPVMEFLVEHLRHHGFDEIVVTTAYLAHEIESYFGDGSRFGVQIAYMFEGYHEHGRARAEGLGSAGGLKKTQEFAGFYDGTFVVLCGDALGDVDLGAAVAFHRGKGALATIVLKEVLRQDVQRYGIVETAPDGRILRFQEKPRPEEAVTCTANTGIYIFEPEVLDHVPSGTKFDIGGQLFPLLVERGLPFFGVTLPFHWIDIGQTSDYWEAVQRVMRGELSFVELPGRELGPGVRGGVNLDVDLSRARITGPVYIGSSTRVEPGAVIEGPTVIGRNCIVESGARIRATVVGNYTRVSGLADLDERVVSGRFCVDRHGRNVDLAGTGYAFVVDDARERRQWTDDQRALIEFLQLHAPAAE
ncbi:MAG TPA: NDP-sugar synthase [Vicinamibacteria bacterium]|nr:NDP-sugar synthase [Vicinamibacteria bacterium]